VASSWLQARWQWLIPQLERYSVLQEQEIRRVCEEEIAAWRRRPEGTGTLGSLRSPMTQTRQRVRQLTLTVHNSWMNPKTRVREHRALKYLTFSADEWKELALTGKQKRQWQAKEPLWLQEPDAVVEKCRQLVQAERWPDLLLGMMMNTGRSLSEIVKVGGFSAKTAYSLVFEGRVQRYDRLPVTFEIPTFACAQDVLAALSRIRRLFAGKAMRTRDISVRYAAAVREAAYRHVLRFVPLPEGEYDLPQMLRLGVYPSLAVYYYCPEAVDTLTYMATVRGDKRLLNASSEEERQFFTCVGQYQHYHVANGRKGMRLGAEGVEVLSACRWMRRSVPV
jgi:telomere resolvase